VNGVPGAKEEHDNADCGSDGFENLRQYIAANVVGDNPPPITTEARALIRAALGPAQEGETSSTA
jgi:hypothetical protein